MGLAAITATQPPAMTRSDVCADYMCVCVSGRADSRPQPLTAERWTSQAVCALCVRCLLAAQPGRPVMAQPHGRTALRSFSFISVSRELTRRMLKIIEVAMCRSPVTVLVLRGQLVGGNARDGLNGLCRNCRWPQLPQFKAHTRRK